MDRRSFIKLLGAGALAPLIPGSAGKAAAAGVIEPGGGPPQAQSRKVVMHRAPMWQA